MYRYVVSDFDEFELVIYACVPRNYARLIMYYYGKIQDIKDVDECIRVFRKIEKLLDRYGIGLSEMLRKKIISYCRGLDDEKNGNKAHT